jgi:hypothetical protein
MHCNTWIQFLSLTFMTTRRLPGLTHAGYSPCLSVVPVHGKQGGGDSGASAAEGAGNGACRCTNMLT